MVGATYAKQIGRAVAFSLAAFRQAFAGGRTLDEDTVVIAAAACEMHPRAVIQALGRRSVAAALDAATAQAAAAGVTQLPAIAIGENVCQGIDAVEQAAAALAAPEMPSA
jgi:2-hydroxychromene-2-carboxylate isomerase